MHSPGSIGNEGEEKKEWQEQSLFECVFRGKASRNRGHSIYLHNSHMGSRGGGCVCAARFLDS